MRITLSRVVTIAFEPVLPVVVAIEWKLLSHIHYVLSGFLLKWSISVCTAILVITLCLCTVIKIFYHESQTFF